MLDLKMIQENPESIRQMLKIRGEDCNLDRLLQLDQERRDFLQKVESLRHQRKERSKEIGQLKKQGKNADAISKEVKDLGLQLEKFEGQLKDVQGQLDNLILFLPNLPQDSVPKGKSSEDNPELRTWGEKPQFSFKPKEHTEIGEKLGILDFDRAAKISGARFALYMGLGAKLERALINFMLDLHTNHHGYQEVIPPFLVNRDAITATGNLPKFAADLFHVPRHSDQKEDEFYLIPTAEVPVTNIHRDEILEAEDLPIAYVAYTPCFRSEAGSYGKDTRGLIRQHQFNKVELVRFSRPENSNKELELLTSHAEKVLQELELPYRVVELCTGDLGFASSKTYDLEVWLSGQNAYREISSCSNFWDFQARRAKIRYRPSKGEKPKLVHTLNGSGLAIGRTLVAILENNQNKDGTVNVPKILRPYMQGLDVIS